MVYMCKVYEFPVKKEIPEEVKEVLQESATEYVKTINEVLAMIVDDDTTEEEYFELSGKVLEAYLEAIIKAVVEYE